MVENNPDDGNLNQNLVNQAKVHFEQKKWEEAVSLFEKSMEICKRNDWNEGIDYANKMISECNIHVEKIEKEREIEIKKAKVEADQIKAKEAATQKAKADAEANAKIKTDELVKVKAKEIPDVIAREDEDEVAQKQVNNKERKENKTKSQEKARNEAIKIQRDDGIRQAKAEADKIRDREIFIQRGDGRLQCPQCKNPKRNMIREVEDRTKVIMDYPLIFGKKYICGQCGVEWRRED